MGKEYKYTVATRCFTYNQATLIADALHGFSMQETRFPAVYLVIDDASTDGEAEVLKQWAAANLALEAGTEPCRIRPYGQVIEGRLKENPLSTFVILLLAENHYRAGIHETIHQYIAEWEGNARYLATCDGDDYWTDSRKLQKQVEILDADDSVGVVYAKALIFSQKQRRYIGFYGEGFRGFGQFLMRSPVCNSTACFRSALYFEYLERKKQWNVSGWKMGDYPMWLWMSYYTTFRFINEEMAVYRNVNGSICHPYSVDERLAFLESGLAVRLFFIDLFRQGDKVKRKIQKRAYRNCALTCIYNGHLKKAGEYLKKVSFPYRCHILLWAFLHYLKRSFLFLLPKPRQI